MATGIPNTEILFDLEALAGLQNKLPPNIAKNISQINLPVIQPTTDPTYRSGFDYARSIAGGMPMSQVIAPGVSYSPEQPGGYTQAQLNTPVGTTPEPTPTYQEPDDPSFLGTGIGGVRIPVDRDMKMPPLRDIFGGFQIPSMKPDIQPITPPVQTPPAIDIDAIRQQIAESGIDFGSLLGIPKYEAPDLSQFVRREDVPSLIPDVPTGRDFSIDREELIRDIREGIEIPKYEMPDLSQFARLEDIPTAPTLDREALIRDIRSGIDIPKPPSIDRQALIEDIRSGIELPTYQAPDLSGFARLEDIPTIPSREDFLSIAREGIDIPQYQAPDLSGFARLEDIPRFDPSQLQEQIGLLQQDIGQITPFDPTGLQQQIGGLQEQIGGITPFDPSTLQQRLGELEQQVPSRNDFMSIQEQIGALQQRPSFDPSQLQEQISGLQSNIASIRPYDPSGLEQQISGLQQQVGSITPFDASALQQQIAANQAAIAGIDIPTYQTPDVSQFVTQEDIQQAIAGIPMPTTPDISGFITQEQLQSALAGIPQPETQDLSGLLSKISELESSLARLQQPTGSTFSISQEEPIGLF
jgi:hypothetical protein